jgi:oligopeptide transport system ATP-binding protein
MRTGPLLSVCHLRTEFRTRRGVITAVDDVSFDLAPGESLGLVGESGSGKSVMMQSILGLVRPAGGEVLFEGRDLMKLSKREVRKVRGNRIGMIFQDPMKSLNPVLTVQRQLTETSRAHTSASRREAEEQAVKQLGLVGIPGAAWRVKQYPHQFSGGMRQRVMMAIGLSNDPALLIADEPTTALDVTVQAQILELVSRMRAELGMALILVSHDLGVVAGLADRVAVMYAGRIVEIGDVDSVYYQPRHPYTKGLLQSMPRLDIARGAELTTIQGAPPEPGKLPSGCAFRSRCAYAQQRCADERPELAGGEDWAAGHQAACWFPLAAPQTAASAPTATA